MIARVATFGALPEDFDPSAVELLRETVKETSGYVAGFHMLDPNTRKALSITVFEDREALAQVNRALAARPDERKVGVTPDRVEFYEAFGF